MNMAASENSSGHCETIEIQHEKRIIDAVLHQPNDPSSGVLVVLTHGAGGDMNLPQLVTLAKYLVEQGFTCLRFTCKGLNITYRTNVYKTVLQYVYSRRDELGLNAAILAGRSMGSRAAAGTANQAYGTALGEFVLGVVCLAYPLHPPKDPANLRDELLRQMKYPCLIINGTADKMCQRNLLETTIGNMEKITEAVGVRIHWVAGADHSHKVKGRPECEVSEEICDAVFSFCKCILPSEVKLWRYGSLGKSKIDKEQEKTCVNAINKGTKRKR